MLYYILNKNLDGNKIIQDIARIMRKIPKDEIETSVLVIGIRKIINPDTTNQTLNIECVEKD